MIPTTVHYLQINRWFSLLVCVFFQWDMLPSADGHSVEVHESITIAAVNSATSLGHNYASFASGIGDQTMANGFDQGGPYNFNLGFFPSW